ncbi:Uncharacterised protein [Yersinia pseudotuberculosis]|uniref:hypothetical protein n=1 Tax=Yersinia pseudotuberculosis TaxID=633 RepID=UPI0005E2BC55|nr:hypothetical protein [Yersinia pseudotuberculosis]CFV38126.1 Uncharacterised protein [Yersinia pseudotuberculosis]CNF69240.1 Uncharacterised protein [Yersinia pseudotuberculosis]CNL20790.1 Uncharacterised protein [Yersinia pseudotuberculosis]BCU90704.1 hypothetical protein YP72344_21990 [Yersinia pseudotuberculosis]BET62824.1 hypothetical protein YPSE1_22830 [Yersinia pseudotuberculosis]
MSTNWMRHFELQILDLNGKGISLSDFKVTFQIEWADTKWPRVANVKIYNLSTDTTSKIIGQEFSKIRIIAGYDGIAPDVGASQVGVVRSVPEGLEGQTGDQNYGLIFDGDIRFTVTGKDNITDSWVLIQAIGDHEAFLFARTKTTIAAGYTVADLHNVTMQGFNAFGVTKGITGSMPTTVFPRGRVLYNASRNVMDNIAAQCNATWQLVDGQVQMVPEDKYIHEAIVLSADTGLVGMPQQTMGAGVNVRCLINPNIRINGLIQLDQASVYRTTIGNNEVAQSPDRISEIDENGNRVLDGTTSQAASIATDGVYIVKAIAYTGDTRGQEWYMDLMCFARGTRDLVNQTAIQKTNY